MVSSKPTTLVGLCSTCNNGPTCGYRALRGCDALFCEMFDDFIPSPNGGISEVDSHLLAAEAILVGRGPKPKVYKGLCVNCENRETCRTAISEGGIWHCEEYR